MHREVAPPSLPRDGAGVRTVCVYCASSDAVGASLRALAREVGDGLARRGWALVYGGGGLGLMGEVARSALAGGADVTGVIPTGLIGREGEPPAVTELVRTETMRERKRLMDERADGFLILPGGVGTLEELLEVLTLRVLGFHDRPIALLDPDGHWDPLRQQVAQLVEAGLAGPAVAAMLEPLRTVEAALDAMDPDLLGA